MIKINSKEYLAERAVEVVRENIVPVQNAEYGFSVQDHIESLPLQVELQLVLYDDNTDNIWSEDSYEHLKQIYESKQLAKVDCSGFAETKGNGAPRSIGKNTVMIYESMAMTFLSQVMQRGNVYFCTVKFTHITKTVVKSQTLYIQEVDEVTDDDGVVTTGATIRWSADKIEPPNAEDAEALDPQPDLWAKGEDMGYPTICEAVWIGATTVAEKVSGMFSSILDYRRASSVRREATYGE